MQYKTYDIAYMDIDDHINPCVLLAVLIVTGHTRALSVGQSLLDPAGRRPHASQLTCKDSLFDVIGVVQRAERTVTSASSFTLLHLLDECNVIRDFKGVPPPPPPPLLWVIGGLSARIPR